MAYVMKFRLMFLTGNVCISTLFYKIFQHEEQSFDNEVMIIRTISNRGNSGQGYGGKYNVVLPSLSTNQV
jgi:hypothetical protein